MPKLTILAVCEKVIVDRSGLPSLVNIFQRMNVQVVEPIPEDVVVPVPWAIFTLWQHTEDELNVEFLQKLEVSGPDGKTFIASESKFKLTEADDRQTKNHFIVNGLPVSKEGFITVRVWVDGLTETMQSYVFFLKYLSKGNELSPGSDFVPRTLPKP